ncbi:hypothetical protein [Neobacillus mesonae]|uniref:Uncharacterized protein n=1 Tax=Neobacillus mesonae TaxID=1193713 RepID=A0A3T0HTD5_9BACI|nr:hypothetical protein [Neobacillus mesonae]AZU60389.1 hypothetical protein CHR53_03400 [Neobacillus mesonae]
MILKKFLIFGEEGVSDVKKSLSFQTRCITNLFEKQFEKYKTSDCKQLNMHCGNYSTLRIQECVDGYCEVIVPFDIKTFLEYPDNNKKEKILELLDTILSYVIKEKDWDPIPFQKASQRVKELNYINEFIWKKPKLNPNKKYNAEVQCKHDLYEFIINIVIKDLKNRIIKKEKLISTKPDELIYERFLGDLEWLNDNEVALYEKHSKRFTSVKLL